MKTRAQVALLLLGIKDLRGGGGIERYFADVFEQYRGRTTAFDLALVTDVQSLSQLQGVGRLRSVEGVILCQAARNLMGLWRQTRCLNRLARSGQFDLCHIVLVTPWYVPFVWLRRWWQRGGRPRLCLNVGDCTIAHSWFDARLRRDRPNRKAYWLYRLFLQTARFDAVFTWYQLFRDRFVGRLSGTSRIVSARYCCVDTERFRPAPVKKNWVVYAGRLVPQKQPLLFVEMVHEALVVAPERCTGWRFLMFGKGPMEADVRTAIERYRLADKIELSHSGSLNGLFAESKVFVSTQDFENFSSLAMLEAMAAGNAVIARDVGQTRWFVRHRENGYLAAEDTPRGLANALLRYLAEPEQHARFAECSRRITIAEHCMENVLHELEEFWMAALGEQPA